MKIKCSMCGRLNDANTEKGFFNERGNTVYNRIFPSTQRIKEDIQEMVECNYCGFVFPSLDECLSQNAKNLLNELEYKNVGKIAEDEEVRKAYKVGLICSVEGINIMAATYFMYAAILSGLPENRNILLKKAFEEIIHDKKKRNSNFLMYINILRMNKLFKATLLEAYDNIVRIENPFEKAIIYSIINLSKDGNDEYYDLFDLLKKNEE